MTEFENPTHQKIVEQAGLPDTHWDNVFNMVEKFNLPVDPFERALDVSHLGPTDLLAMTTLIHSVVAPNVDQNPFAEQSTVSSVDGIPKPLAKPEDRYSIFEHAAKLTQKLGNQLQPGLEVDYLERASNIYAMAGVLAHTFQDGNGRTARTLAYLIREGGPQSDEQKDDIKLLGSPRTGEVRLPSFLPSQTVENTQEYLDEVAALNVPLTANVVGYQKATNRLFATSFERTY